MVGSDSSATRHFVPMSPCLTIPLESLSSRLRLRFVSRASS